MIAGSSGRAGVLLSAALAAVALTAALRFGDPQAQPPVPPCETLFEDTAPGSPGRANFPVVVHVMQNTVLTGRNVLNPNTGFPAEKIRKGFDPDGLFNRIWKKEETGIRFSVVRIESCRYRLADFPDVGFSDAPDTDVPSPESINGLDLFKRIVAKYNAKTYLVGGTTTPFVGLDLYLWWEIQDASGAGFSTRRRHGHGGPGAAWMDRDCLEDPNTCDRVFAHEASHFLGLCHRCAQEDSHEMANSRCQCGLANHPLPRCTDALRKDVMHPLANGTEFSTCAKHMIRTNAGKVLGLNSN
jgi:hypothetical protein